MRLEERKLQFIQRCMNIENEADIHKVEEVLNSLEIDRRAQASEQDIVYGKVKDYDQFSAQIKTWLEEIKRSA